MTRSRFFKFQLEFWYQFTELLSSRALRLEILNLAFLPRVPKLKPHASCPELQIVLKQDNHAWWGRSFYFIATSSSSLWNRGKNTSWQIPCIYMFSRLIKNQKQNNLELIHIAPGFFYPKDSQPQLDEEIFRVWSPVFQLESGSHTHKSAGASDFHHDLFYYIFTLHKVTLSFYHPEIPTWYLIAQCINTVSCCLRCFSRDSYMYGLYTSF